MATRKTKEKEQPTYDGYVIRVNDEDYVHEEGCIYNTIEEAKTAAEADANDNERENDECYTIYGLIKVRRGDISYERRIEW